MFLLGVDINHRSGQGAVVIIKKKLKNVRHCYTVQQIIQIPAARCPREIENLYRDSRYISRKMVFSQDRRPRKDINAHPVIITTVTDNDLTLIDNVRESDIPVEALFLTDGNPAPNETPPVKPGLGRNLIVSEKMLIEAAITVTKQQRLTVEATTPAAGMLRSELETIMNRVDAGGNRPDGAPGLLLLPALAAPLWYRENSRYRQVYRTSSTCVRQYK